MAGYTMGQFIADVKDVQAAHSDPKEILQRVAPLAKKIADAKAWLNDSHYRVEQSQGIGITIIHEEPEDLLRHHVDDVVQIDRAPDALLRLVEALQDLSVGPDRRLDLGQLVDLAERHDARVVGLVADAPEVVDTARGPARAGNVGHRTRLANRLAEMAERHERRVAEGRMGSRVGFRD